MPPDLNQGDSLCYTDTLLICGCESENEGMSVITKRTNGIVSEKLSKREVIVHTIQLKDQFLMQKMKKKTHSWIFFFFGQEEMTKIKARWK